MIAVTPQLVDGVYQWLGDGGAFAFHDNQRNSVHQQHQVRNNELLAAVVAWRAVHSKLVDDGEVVVARCFPINVLDRLTPPTVPARKTTHSNSLEQQLGGLLVGLHQLGGTKAGDRGNGFADALVIQPRLSIAQVDGSQPFV